MKPINSRRRPPPGMPTPLVDFAFVLVLLFLILVAAQPVLEQTAVQADPERLRPVVDLPGHDAQHESSTSESENVVELTITADSTYWWNGESVPRESLPSRFRAGNLNELRLRADRDVPFGVIGELLREADRAGIPRTAFLFVSESGD